MEIEGLILNKFPHQERNLVVQFITRQGLKQSVIFYGGRGGGKNSKPSLLELGNLIKVKLKKSKGDMAVAQEWELKWGHQQIRYNYKAFLLMCLYVEIINKFVVESTEHIHDQEGLFNVLSNGLFYVEKSLEEKNFILHQQLGLFLTKLLYHMGVAPDLESCMQTGIALNEVEHFVFEVAEGGFLAVNAGDVRFEEAELAKAIRYNLGTAQATKYSDYSAVLPPSKEVLTSLMGHLFHHHNIQLNTVKGLSQIF